MVCGVDRQAGGTWLGVNQYGLFCAVTNRRKFRQPLEPRSRGLLCRELLDMRNARDAAAYAAKELATGAYAGANYICADAKYAAVVHGADKVEIVELTPGLHVISSGDVNSSRDERDEFVRRMLELHTLDSAVTFLAVASRVFSRKSDDGGRRGIVTTGGDFGTVSSTLISLPRKIQQAVYQYAPGPPCDCAYDDLSALLRQVLSTERSRKSREADGNGVKEPEKAPVKAKVGASEPVKKKK
jgi:hypothetical protein